MRPLLLCWFLVLASLFVSPLQADVLARVLRNQDFSTTLTQIERGSLQGAFGADAVAQSLLALEGVYTEQERDSLLLGLVRNTADDTLPSLLDVLSNAMEQIDDWSIFASLLEQSVSIDSRNRRELSLQLLDRYLDLRDLGVNVFQATPALMAALTVLSDESSTAVIELAREVSLRAEDRRIVFSARSLIRSMAQQMR